MHHQPAKDIAKDIVESPALQFVPQLNDSSTPNGDRSKRANLHRG
jgi:hypothetical protein